MSALPPIGEQVGEPPHRVSNRSIFIVNIIVVVVVIIILTSIIIVVVIIIIIVVVVVIIINSYLTYDNKMNAHVQPATKPELSISDIISKTCELFLVV